MESHPEDSQTQNFIKYRQSAKIPSLSAKVVTNERYVENSTDQATKDPNRVHVDLVYNMLLNP